MSFVVTPGEAHVVGGPHLGALRSPCQLVSLWIPIRLGSDSCNTQHGGFAIVQSDRIIGEPVRKRFSSACCHRLCKTSFKLQQKKNSRTESWLNKRAGD